MRRMSLRTPLLSFAVAECDTLCSLYSVEQEDVFVYAGLGWTSSQVIRLTRAEREIRGCGTTSIGQIQKRKEVGSRIELVVQNGDAIEGCIIGVGLNQVLFEE